MNFRDALEELAPLDKSDLDTALRKILAVDAEVMGVARVSYWELAPGQSVIRCKVLYDQGTFTSGGQLRSSDFPAYFRAMLECRAIVADDAWLDPRTNEFVETYFKPTGIRSMLDIPVWRCGKLAGVLCHEHVSTTRTWSIEEQDFAVAIATMVSAALEARERTRAEQRYALVAKATNDVLWDWDMTTDTLEWNDTVCTVFRYAPSQLDGTLSWWHDRVHADDLAHVYATMTNAIENGQESWTAQYRFRRGDGTWATVIDRGIIVRNDAGAPVRMVGSFLDISDRVEMQARLAMSDHLASVGMLAAGVAHEINNPLTYVLTNLMAAIDDVRAGKSDAILECLGDAREGAERIQGIVRDLQLFSRPREDEVEAVDVQRVIESSLSVAANEIRHRARVVKDYGPVPSVRMNRARLGQVVLNLLVNAAHAIREGNADQNEIRVVTRTDGAGNAVIEVTDTGCGIPPGMLANIFVPFFTTKPIGQGTGLGLSICHSIVAAAQGRIDVISPPGGGCTMRVILPALVVLKDVATSPAETARDSRRRILVVDDEPNLRRAIRRMLEPHHDVRLVESGQSALEHLLAGESYDVILCDLMMPHTTGMDVFDRLVGAGSPLAQRMVFMTGGAFSQRSSDFLSESAQPCLEKPFNRSDLLRTIDTFYTGDSGSDTRNDEPASGALRTVTLPPCASTSWRVM